MKVFADSFALIAWLNPRDRYHAKVSQFLEAYVGRIVTTEWVLMEVADALAAPEARSRATEFLTFIRADPDFELVGYLPTAYEDGFELYATRPDKAWSLTDCISFAVMTEQELTEALTADHHFEQAGFRAMFK